MREETAMELYLQVPDSVTQAIRLPEKRMREDLLLELAVALYAREVLPFGKARELAGATRREFAHTHWDSVVGRATMAQTSSMTT